MISKIVKRLFDIFASAVFLIGVFPAIFILVAPVIKFTSPGPVFFRQKRTGLKDRVFICYKFRTMFINAECDRKQATVNDIRVTKPGLLLRKSFIDEFPQFWNVLKGDMSVIGPRPHMLYHTGLFSESVAGYNRRHDMRPGITGLAQVNGYIGEIKTTEDIAKRVKYDLEYIDSWSLALDIKILIKSVRIFFKILLKGRSHEK